MTITLTETPKIKYSETSTDPTVGGDGAEIPVIMGITGNSTPASGILTFRNYSAACKTVANGGIGTDTSTNPLLAFLKKFFEENVQKESSDLVVPYVYVIDLGTGRTTTGSGNEAVTTLTTATFTTAFANAKIKRDATAEVLVGFEKDDTAAQIIPLIDSALAAIAADAVRGSPRILYFGVDGMTMDELKSLTLESSSFEKRPFHILSIIYYSFIISKSLNAMRSPLASRVASNFRMRALAAGNLTVCQMGLLTILENSPLATTVQLAQSVDTES